VPKTSAADLALFGGRPLFPEPVHVGRPNIGNRERLLARINGALDTRWVSNDGPLVQELESRLADYLGVQHAVALCNGTVALELAARTLGLTGEVLVPSFTFVATAHALAWQGITPVFCDIDPRTHSLDPQAVERKVGPHTSGILGVHIWGEPCALEALAEIADRRKLALLLDASHAFGCTHHGRTIGCFGRAEVFSFHATKFFHTFEGGAVATDDAELAASIRLMRNFGFTGYDQVARLGTNGKMSEISAAMGLTGLEGVADFVAANRSHYERYRSWLVGVAGIRFFRLNEAERRNYQYVVVEVDENAAGIGRDLLLEVLHAENVLARRYFYPGCHRMEPYASRGGTAADLPNTEKLCGRVLVLPTGTALDGEDVEKICGLIRLGMENAEEIQARWQQRRSGNAQSVSAAEAPRTDVLLGH
jgi:dTDP-4-amino-4,6-dideoxygalactose transaminase